MILASAWPLWRPLLCSSLCGKTCSMARSASRVLACGLLALACSAMLCFVGTTPSPAAGSTPLKQSLRAPAVQMEARGGGEGALGDMSPDTYIIGITVLGIASLFANISGFFNPWENMRRPESGSGHDIEVFSILTSEGSICCPWQSRSPCDLGRHSVFEGTNADRQWACFPCWYVLLAAGPGCNFRSFQIDHIWWYKCMIILVSVCGVWGCLKLLPWLHTGHGRVWGGSDCSILSRGPKAWKKRGWPHVTSLHYNSMSSYFTCEEIVVS